MWMVCIREKSQRQNIRALKVENRAKETSEDLSDLRPQKGLEIRRKTHWSPSFHVFMFCLTLLEPGTGSSHELVTGIKQAERLNNGNTHIPKGTHL